MDIEKIENLVERQAQEALYPFKDAEARKQWCEREVAYYVLVDQIKAALVEKGANGCLWKRIKVAVDKAIVDVPLVFRD